MFFAFWAVLIAAVQPLIWAVVAKSGGGYDNHRPREYLARLEGWRQRAQWAQQNSWEAFAQFTAAIMVAYLMLVPPAQMNGAAVVFVVARFAYGFCYITDRASLRSLCWSVAFAAILYLFLAAARIV